MLSVRTTSECFSQGSYRKDCQLKDKICPTTFLTIATYYYQGLLTPSVYWNW